jgi:tetratricopeptide (TPR) repeat protein
MAQISRERGDHLAAIEYYRRALAQDYGQVQTRLSYARTLAAAGEIDQAMHEARICLRLRPQMKSALKLIADLSVRSSDVSDQ